MSRTLYTGWAKVAQQWERITQSYHQGWVRDRMDEYTASNPSEGTAITEGGEPPANEGEDVGNTEQNPTDRTTD